MKTWSTKAMALGMSTLGVSVMAALGLSGCEAVLGKILPPGVEYKDAVLVESPSAREMARWGCFETLGDFACEAAGFNKVNKSKLQFSFDVVFDLSNKNEKLPIPLVEILLATTVYDGESLGAVCISFCDPDEESCEAEANAEGACDSDGAEDVDAIGDLVPTVDELHDIASGVLDDGIDNGEFRVIPAQSDIEAHILFDFDIDTMLGILDNVLVDLGGDLIDGRNLSVDIPYTMDGSLFFNVPEMGRYAAGFGPVDDNWTF